MWLLRSTSHSRGVVAATQPRTVHRIHFSKFYTFSHALAVTRNRCKTTDQSNALVRVGDRTSRVGHAPHPRRSHHHGAVSTITVRFPDRGYTTLLGSFHCWKSVRPSFQFAPPPQRPRPRRSALQLALSSHFSLPPFRPHSDSTHSHNTHTVTCDTIAA